MSNLVALGFCQGERAAVSLRLVDKGSDHIDVIFRNLQSCNVKMKRKKIILFVGIITLLRSFRESGER